MAETFAELVKEQRQHWGLTQEEAAHLVGISVRTLADWERGKHQPRIYSARVFADAFGLEIPLVMRLREDAKSP